VNTTRTAENSKTCQQLLTKARFGQFQSLCTPRFDGFYDFIYDYDDCLCRFDCRFRVFDDTTGNQPLFFTQPLIQQNPKKVVFAKTLARQGFEGRFCPKCIHKFRKFTKGAPPGALRGLASSLRA
jgi:hypothetical protein